MCGGGQQDSSEKCRVTAGRFVNGPVNVLSGKFKSKCENVRSSLIRESMALAFCSCAITVSLFYV